MVVAQLPEPGARPPLDLLLGGESNALASFRVGPSCCFKSETSDSH